MSAIRIEDLPAPPEGRSGWPWTEASERVPPTRPDGSPWPSVSVVTPSFNQGQYLEETIRSVLLQGYPNLEYFVMDGGSSDESIAIIKKYESWLSGWVSRPDKGQADAIASGLERCSGEIFNFINSDDYLMPNTIRIVADGMRDATMYAGACENFENNDTLTVIQNRNLSAVNLIQWEDVAYHQPAIWLSRTLIHQCGGVARDVQFYFDFDLFVRYLAVAPQVEYTTSRLARFRLHGASKTVSQQHKFDWEFENVMARLYGNPQFPELRKACEMYFRRQEWWRTLSDLNTHSSGIGKALRIVFLSFNDPSIRWSRMTAGAIRRALRACEATAMDGVG